ncbi:hypothetical protein E2562_037418 [Oryza meyeriana var. granulata]|uniref:Uncharacterized protein n=1 Tax=Oryza meyeriana var. granulata TaxID=110450 RepID=A0A6G1ECL2_9ORYZ|nr:hypothetical protein E2562_037418 [Oryza meyeriana var. granulata]
MGREARPRGAPVPDQGSRKGGQAGRPMCSYHRYTRAKKKIVDMCMDFYKRALESCIEAIEPIIAQQTCKMADFICTELFEGDNVAGPSKRFNTPEDTPAEEQAAGARNATVHDTFPSVGTTGRVPQDLHVEGQAPPAEGQSLLKTIQKLYIPKDMALEVSGMEWASESC